ncbi:MAG: MlaD family protein [Solirubrobacteraceae bacterium]
MKKFVLDMLGPRRAARAIPLGRLAIAATFAFVVLFVAFTLGSMGVQLPFVSHPYTIYAEMDNAAGLNASNGPQVSVAGVPEGQVTAVQYDHGRARVTIQLSGDVRGKVFADASVRVRPFNAANFLELDITPGDPATGLLPAGATIDPARASIPVSTDQVLNILDADTRSYLQLLTEQAQIALHGTGGELAGALAQLNPLSSEAKLIGDMLAQRRTLIGQLVAESDTIFSALAARHSQLAGVIADASRILAVTGSRTAELQRAVAQLPAVLGQATTASDSFASLAPTLQRALTGFGPAARAFATGLQRTGAAVPALGRFVSALRSLEQGTGSSGTNLDTLTRKLGSGVGQAVTSYRNLDTIMAAIIAHGQSIANSSDALSGVFSTQDHYGPLARVKILGIEPLNPADLGLSAAAAKPGASGKSPMQLMLGQALSALCRRQALACAAQALVAAEGKP